MPIHMNEHVFLPKRCDSELFNWVEERLESIGLNGKLYSRVMKSVLNSNLDEEEFELKLEHKKLPCDDLLINEILLASMWKGNEKTDDYWIFKKVITDFVNRYKSKDTSNIADIGSSDSSDASEERYEEAFPSLSNACDEIAWGIPKWKYGIGPISSIIESSLPYFNNQGEICSNENKLGCKQRFKGRGKRQRKGIRALSTMRWNNRPDDVDGIVTDHTVGNGSPLFDGNKTDNSSAKILFNGQSHQEIEIVESLKLILSNWNKHSQPQAVNLKDTSCIQPDFNLMPSTTRNNLEVISNEHLIICNLLTLPFFPEKMLSPNRITRLGTRSLIPDHPWSSNNFKDFNDHQKNEPNNNVGNDLCTIELRDYPQSPLPYFHPDPPSFALFPWGI